MRTLIGILLTAMILLAIGCEGEQGPMGPSGDDGNANVVTGMISPPNEDWLWNSFYWFSTPPTGAQGYLSRYVDIPVAEITPDILATGAVLVSFQAYLLSTNWTPLPFQFVDGGAGIIYNIVYEVMEGNIRLHYFNTLNSAGAAYPDLETLVIPTYTFKYTVIGGTSLDDMEVSGIDISDHEQVLEYLAVQ